MLKKKIKSSRSQYLKLRCVSQIKLNTYRILNTVATFCIGGNHCYSHLLWLNNTFICREKQFFSLERTIRNLHLALYDSRRQLVPYIANDLFLPVSALLEEQLFSLIINYTRITLLHIREYTVETHKHKNRTTVALQQTAYASEQCWFYTMKVLQE